MCVNLRTSCVLGRWALLVPSDTTRQVQAGGSDSQSNHIHCTANSRRKPIQHVLMVHLILVGMIVDLWQFNLVKTHPIANPRG
eukprot:1109042-Pyramimonas_sp.AAC.4